MHFEIAGEIAQTVRLSFEQGETAWASRGSLVAYSQGLNWTLRVPGGVTGALRRSLSGEGISLIFLQTPEMDQYALLAANEPGHITVWDLDKDGPVVTTRGAFLAAFGDDVQISVTIAKRTGAALFGGAGLFLQRISGHGKALIHGSGDFQQKNLESGEVLVASTGNLAAFADSVDYSIQGVGGFRKTLFGGEGFFMTRLQGPGRVLLQTLKRTLVSSRQTG